MWNKICPPANRCFFENYYLTNCATRVESSRVESLLWALSSLLVYYLERAYLLKWKYSPRMWDIPHFEAAQMARKVAPGLAPSAATLAAIFPSEGVVLYSKMIIPNEVYSCVVGLIRKSQLMFAPFEQRLFFFDSAEGGQCWLVQSLSFGRFFSSSSNSKRHFRLRNPLLIGGC